MSQVQFINSMGIDELKDVISEVSKEVNGIRYRGDISCLKQAQELASYFLDRSEEIETEHLAPDWLLDQLNISQPVYARWMKEAKV